MVLNVASPAKLNLFLAVGPKDAIGYHPIRTVFQAIGLFDQVLIDLDVEETSVEFTGLKVPEQNTVAKALRLMSELGELPKMAIRIQKSIPPMAGLGGGSSNAGAVIRALRYLIPHKLTEQDAFAIAGAVGADVPFFLIGGKSKGEGYGEKLTPLPDPAIQEWALVVKPPVDNATADMYAALDQATYSFAEFPDGDIRYNDFERAACDLTDIVERLMDFGARSAGMTGSGSALFGLFDTEARGLTAMNRALAENLGRAWVVPLLNRAQSLRIDVL